MPCLGQSRQEKFGVTNFTRYLAAFAAVSLVSNVLAQEPEPSPSPSKFLSGSGAWFIEANGFDASLVSTNDPAQKIKIPAPGEEDSLNPDDEFYLSPNDEWIYAGRHGGSCLRSGDLYHRTAANTIERLTDFDQDVWSQGTKLHSMKTDWLADGSCAMTFFVAWSSDSARLLVGLLGGPDRHKSSFGYVYYNTRTKHFETSDYLRKLNAAKGSIVPCAEPLGSLPNRDELKARVEALDLKLNQAFAARLKNYSETAEQNRRSQRDWIKARDNGLKLYLASKPKAEAETRRLQFLADVTAARIDSLNQPEESVSDFWERKAGE